MSESKFPSSAMKKIVLQDLQPVLQEVLGDRLIVKSFVTESLLPPGENYGSTIFKVEAVVKREHENSKDEELHLIAKMPPPTDFQRHIFDSPYTFKKEIAMYKEIFPMYQRLEMEYCVDEDVFDVLPKFYGSRLSIDPHVEFDDHAVILLENLKVRGYYTGKRAIGYNLEHAKLAILAMARFHALGMGMKYKKPEEFEHIKKRAECMKKEFEDLEESVSQMMKSLFEDPKIAPYAERCGAVFQAPECKDWTTSPGEPWQTIVHTDFWVNNILFHKDQSGRVDDVKFVDFQNYLLLSPLRELIFFLYSSVDDDVYENHIDELIELYYETFIRKLNQFECDVTPFARDKFDARIPIDAKIEFVHLSFMIKVLTLDVKEMDFDYDKMPELFAHKGSSMYIDKLRRLILSFVDRNWI